MSANTHITDKPKRKAPRTAWKKGQSGNPAGAPKRGESWAEIIKVYGDMTPQEIADKAKDIAGQLKKIGNGISMKEAVVIRIFASLMFEPSSSLWKELMERTDGKITDSLDLSNKDGSLKPTDNSQILARVNQLIELAKQRKAKDK